MWVDLVTRVNEILKGSKGHGWRETNESMETERWTLRTHLIKHDIRVSRFYLKRPSKLRYRMMKCGKLFTA